MNYYLVCKCGHHILSDVRHDFQQIPCYACRTQKKEQTINSIILHLLILFLAGGLITVLLMKSTLGYTLNYGVYPNKTISVMNGANILVNLTLNNTIIQNGTDLTITDCEPFSCLLKINLSTRNAITLKNTNFSGITKYSKLGTAQFESVKIYEKRLVNITVPRYSNYTMQYNFTNCSNSLDGNITGCFNETKTANWTAQNGTRLQLINSTGWHPINTTFTLAAGKNVLIGLQYTKTNNESTDLIPTIFNMNLTGWAWWNASYANKFPINCSLVDNDNVILLNGTNGATISGTKYYIWTNCYQNLSLYYNNATDFTIANDTSNNFNYEVENNTALSKNATGVWTKDTSLFSVYHMDGTGANGEADASNQRNLTKAGTVAAATGPILGARGPYAANPDDLYNNTAAPGYTDTSDFTTCTIVKSSSTSPATQSIFSFNVGSGSLIVYLAYGWSANNWNYIVYRGGSTVRTATYTMSSLNTSKWYHICGTYNGSSSKKMQIYIDGIPGTEGTYSDPSASGSSRLGIGYGFWAPNLISDETRIYSATKTPNWINQTFKNYNNIAGYGMLETNEAAPAGEASTCYTQTTQTLIIPPGCAFTMNLASKIFG